MYIKFSVIPETSALFLNFLYNYENVRDFYPTNFRDEQELVKNLENYNKNLEHREKLVHILKRQNITENSSEKTIQNLNHLLSENTFAIVTGQQLGILSGPLYTFYKIITTIKLAEKLNIQYPELKFVPVFWLESEDHDFDEVNWIKILDNQNNLVKITYNDGKEPETNRGPIGENQFNLSFNDFIITLRSSLRDTEFQSQLMDIVQSYYFPGATFKSAFVGLVKHFFDKYGLILLDSNDLEVKKWLSPIFAKDIEKFSFISEELILRSAKIEEQFSAQVKIKPINLFYFEDGGRYLIEPDLNNEFRLKNKRKKFTYEKLLSEIENSPEKFSPNVVLRPICQDYLLPTAYYVAGPSEINYHAQIYPYYSFHNLHPPILYPRASATLLESKVKSILEKYYLSVSNFYGDIEVLVKNVAEKNLNISISSIFDEVKSEIDKSYEHLKETLITIDLTLRDVVENAKQKTETYLNVVKEKTIAAHQKKNEIVLRQIYKAGNILYPDGNLQEREINFIYFANKYSLDFIDFLYDNLNIEIFDHQIIEIQ